MTTWQNLPLSKLGRINRGKSKHRPRNDSSLFGGEYPFIQTSDVKHAGFYVNTYTETYNESGLAQSKLWPKDTLCMTIAANIAETALLSFPACFPDSVVGFIEDPDKSDVRFVKYSLDYYKKQYQKRSQGAAQDNLSLEKIESLKLKAPPVSLQKRIADVINAYDNLIENNEKRIKILEEMAQRLYTEWFVKFKFPGYEQVKMADSSLGKIPEGWGINEISELIKVISGYSFKSSSFQDEGKYKIVTIRNVHDGYFVQECESFINDLPSNLPINCILTQGDILLSLTGNVGRVCFVLGDDYLLNQRVAKIVPKKDSFKEYIYIKFRQSNFQRKLEAISNGAAQQNLSPIQLAKIKVLIPSIEILNQFNNRTRNIFNLAINLKMQNTELAQMRDLLILQLVTGRKELKSD